MGGCLSASSDHISRSTMEFTELLQSNSIVKMLIMDVNHKVGILCDFCEESEEIE